MPEDLPPMERGWYGISRAVPSGPRPPPLGWILASTLPAVPELRIAAS